MEPLTKNEIVDGIDFESIQGLLVDFHTMTGLPISILDPKGSVLAGTERRAICENFHRVNPESARHCTESNIVLAKKTRKNLQPHFAKCLNGLIDVVVPIVIHDIHVANLHSGQFLLAEPDRDFFTKQAEKYGFDKRKYLDALDQVPVVSEEYIHNATRFLQRIIQQIGETAIQGIKEKRLFTDLEKSERKTKAANQQLAANEQQLRAANQQLLQETKKLKKAEKEILEYTRELEASQKAALNLMEDAMDQSVKLEQSEYRYRQLVETASDAIYLMDENGDVIDANQSACAMLGRTREELLKLSIGQIDVNFPAHDFVQFWKDTPMGEQRFFETNHVTKDGSFIPVEVSGKKIKQGNSVFYYGIARDVTIRKKQERILKIKNEISEVLHSQDDQQIFAGILDIVLQTQESRHGVFGYIGEDGSLVCPSMTRDIWNECNIEDKSIVFPREDWGDSLWGNALRNKKGAYANKPFQVPKGHLPVERFLSVPLVYQNESVGLISVGNKPTDYTDDDFALLKEIADYLAPIVAARLQKAGLLRDLRESEKKFRSYIENAPDGIFIADENGRYLEVNPAAEKITGYSQEELIHMNVGDLFEKDEVAKSIQHFQTVRQKGSAVGEFRVITKSGAKRYWLVAAEKVSATRFLGFVKDITEGKQAEKALADSEARHRLLFENAGLGIGYFSQEGEIIAFNNKACEFMGGKSEDFTGKNVTELYGMEMGAQYLERIKSACRSRQAQQYEDYVPLPIGARWLRSTFNRILNTEETVIGVQVISSDITESKEAAEALRLSEERLRLILDSSPFPVAVVDEADARISLWSKSAQRMFGHTPDTTREWYHCAYPDPDYRKEVIDRWKPALEKARQSGEAINTGEYAVTCRDGSVKTCELHAQFIPGNLIVTLNDITTRKAAELAVEEQRNFLDRIIESSALSTWISDEKGTAIRVNPAFLEFFGVSEEEIVGKYNLLKDEAVISQGLLPEIEKVYSKGEVANIILDYGSGAGENVEAGNAGWKTINAIITPVIDPKGNVTHAIIQAIDLTELKQAEKQLKLSEQRYRSLVDTINSGVAIYKVTGDGKSGSDYIIQEFNQFSLDHEGLGREEVIGKSLKDIRPNIDDYGLIDVFREVWKTGEPAFFPAKIYVDEKYANYYENRVFRLSNGEVVAVYDDVTERERALDKLRENEERFSLAMEASRDGIFDWNLVTNEIYYSPGWMRMLGYESDELPNDFSVWEKLTDPEDVKRSWAMQQEVVDGKRDRFQVEFKMKHKDGHWVDILSRAFAVFDENNKAIRMIGTHVDVSEQKRTREQLRFEKERTRQYLDAAGVMMVALGKSQDVMLMNPKGCEILGYTEKEILGKNWFDTFLPLQSRKGVKEVFDQIIAGNVEDVKYHENEVLCKDGSLRDMAWHNSILRDADNEIIGLFSSGEDITEKKKAEESLKESEEKFRLLAENSVDAIWQMDLRMNFTYISESIYQLTGHTQEEWIGTNLAKHATRKEFFKMARKALGAVKNYKNFDYTVIDAKLLKKNGEEFPVEIIGKLLLNKKGLPIGLQGSTRDISERKKAELELKESEQRLRGIVEDMPVLMKAFNENGSIVAWNSECARVTGYKMKEMVNTPAPLKKLYPEQDDRDGMIADIARPGHTFRNREYKLTCKDGSRKHILWSNISKEYPVSGWYAWVIGVDVTELRLAREELEKYYETLEELVEKRTAEIKEKNEFLERMNDAMVDREYRMKELRDEIERLKKQ